ncbi:thiosulfate reductase cytochrome B subunit, partial [Escherichia coli]|nr:thiosulfate reductase cytochrome B subunit [Escherichia coli]
FLLLACWLGFVLINAVGGNGHHYRIRRQGWLDRAAKQTRFYLFGIMQGEEHPFPATTQSKFNPLQQVAYVGVMYGLLPLLLLTGLLCLYPQAVGDVLPGVRYWLLQAHFALAFISLFFIFGHLYLCTTGRTPHETFKSMVDGYHRH